MTIELRVVLIVASLLTTLLIMRKIRNSKMQIEDSLFWIGFSAMLILFSVVPAVPDMLARLVGTYTTANFIYIAVIFLLIVKLFYMTIKLSQMETRLRELVQQMALMEHQRNRCAEDKPDKEPDKEDNPGIVNPGQE